MSEHIGVHVYYGSRSAQPRRVRAFIDLAIEQLADTPRYVLTAKELKTAASSLAKARSRSSKA